MARAAALVRNQCDLVMGYHLAASSIPSQNGETAFLDQLGPIERFIDVGANVGDWTVEMLARQPGARGIAVEPGEQALARLRKRVPGSVITVAAVVGASEGTVSFFEDADAGEWSSLVASWAAVGAVRRSVPMVTIDGLLAEHHWDSVDYLKIDTEGYDAHVLEGASAALREHRIGIIQFEYNHPWREGGRTLAGALSVLRDAGYEVLALRPGGPEPYSYEPFGEFFSYSNFVAIRPGAARAAPPIPSG